MTKCHIPKLGPTDSCIQFSFVSEIVVSEVLGDS